MSSTTTSTTTNTIKTKDRSSSSASQKFWPLKKFGLHHGKTDEQPIALSTNNNTIKSTNEPLKETIEKDAQKKSKNKRLSSLLSSRRQEANIQNLQSHVNTPESIAADSSKRQSTNASNTPTLTRKMGRDITRTRNNSQNTTVTNVNVSKHNYNMTAKSAGSGTLSRSNTFNSTSPIFVTPQNNNKPTTRTRELKNNSVRRTSEDKLLKRSQSPPKRNDSPTQPNIMLESVQQQIQLEQLLNMSDDVDNDSAIEEDDYEDDQQSTIKKDTITKSANNNNIIEFDSPPIKNIKKSKVQENSIAELKPDTKEEEEEVEEEFKEDSKNRKQQSPLPSPPVTPAVIDALPEFIRDNSTLDTTSAADITCINSEPVSPTMCTFDVQSVQNNNKLNESDKLLQSNNLFVQQQPIQRINRLRPAASFATLRQLANNNNNSNNNSNNYQQHHHQQQQQQQPFQQQHNNQQISHIKRRPVSFIESGNNSNYNYTLPVAANEDYLTVNRPTYYRRASSEDNRHFHIRQQSDNNNPIQYNNVASRRLVRSNTVHNLIIKDGYGHRIVQCVGLDESPQQPILRRKNSSFESNDSIHNQDWTPPTEIIDDSFFSSRQQQLEEQHHQQQLLLIQQQQLMIQQDNTDTSSSDSSSHQGISNRRVKRKDSAKSISSLCSASPPITSYDTKFEKLKSKLDKERATVKALQKQKEAYNKDVLFLSKNVDDLIADNLEWKKKFENEKVLKERFQDDLSSTMDKLNEATEQLRQLENQSKILKSEIDDKNKEIRELEKKKQSTVPVRGKTINDGKSTDRLLAAQLQHSQNQVRLLKSTMEQFLRMGVFNDDLNSSNLTSPTISIEAVVSEFKRGRSKQSKRPGNKSTTTNNVTDETPNDTIPPPIPNSRSRKSLVPTEIVEISKKTTKTPEKKVNSIQDDDTEELDTQLRELLREKELLQAEYSKAPSSGGNALVRRRREELESRLDTVDSQMCRIKLKMRSRNIL